MQGLMRGMSCVTRLTCLSSRFLSFGGHLSLASHINPIVSKAHRAQSSGSTLERSSQFFHFPLLFRDWGEQFTFVDCGLEVLEDEQFHLRLSFVSVCSQMWEQEDLLVLN